MARKIGDSHAHLSIHHAMEVRREEYLDYMTFRANERPLFTEIFGPLVGVKEEWAAQGGSPAELDLSAFRYRRAMNGFVGVNCGFRGGCEEEILEETQEHIIARDQMGRRVKLCKGSATIPLPMEYPIETMDDWRKFKHHYEFHPDRLGENWLANAKKDIAEGRVLTVGIPGGFDQPRQLLGEENLCLALYDDPEMIHDMLDTIGATAQRVLETVINEVQVDQLYVHEDLAGRSGPLMGPNQITEFIRPYYRRLWDMMAAKGTRLFTQDSDGNMNAVIDAFIDAGVNVMFPMEPAAGMDMVAVREKYGKRLAIMGGIDKHVLRKSQAEIAAELEYKIPPMVKTGGCMIGLDHRIPNGTPLENYRFYIRKAWEIMERA